MKMARMSGIVMALALAIAGLRLPNVATATPQSLAAPDERIGKDIHSIMPGDLTNPGFGQAVAKRFFAGQSRVLLTAHSDTAWPDALAIGPVAGKTKQPLFITTPNQQLPDPDAAYISEHAKTITVLGGPAVISEAVVAQWRAKGKTVHRIAGSNRFSTAAHIAANYWPNGADTVILARGDNPADAISGQPLGTKLNAPILLTQPHTLPQETRDALSALQPKRIIALGGVESIAPEVMAQVQALLPQTTSTRIAGPTRFETSQHIANTFFADRTEVFTGLNHTQDDKTTMATGMWADMFQLAPVAGAHGAPLILAPAIHHYLANPIKHTVYAYDPGTKVGVDFYEHEPLWGNVDLAWREAALIRAKAGLETLKSCSGVFNTRWQGWGGATHKGDGSIWTNGWSAAVFTTSPGHLEVLLDKNTNYVRVVAQTLRESHGDNYAQHKPGVEHLMDQRGLSLRVGRCIPGSKTDVPIEQRRVGPNELSL